MRGVDGKSAASFDYSQTLFERRPLRHAFSSIVLNLCEGLGEFHLVDAVRVR
jgi:hypothetical protein